MIFIGSMLAAVVTLVAVVGFFTTLPDAVRALSAIRRSPIAIAGARTGAVAIRGRVRAENLLSSLIDGEPLAWRRLVVSEQVGRRRRVRIDAVATRGSVLVEDASGVARVGFLPDTRVLSAPVCAGRVANTAALPAGVRAAVSEGVFAWPRTPKLYHEHRLVPGAEVTVVGAAQEGPGGLAVDAQLVVVGETRPMRVEEVRFVVYSAVTAVIAGALSIPFFQAFH